MRLTALFLVCLISVLAVYPCQDLDAAAAVQPDEVRVALPEDAPGAPAPHSDDCTPFCFCACCGTVCTASVAEDPAAVRLPLPPVGKTHPQSVPVCKSYEPVRSDIQPPRA